VAQFAQRRQESRNENSGQLEELKSQRLKGLKVKFALLLKLNSNYAGNGSVGVHWKANLSNPRISIRIMWRYLRSLAPHVEIWHVQDVVSKAPRGNFLRAGAARTNQESSAYCEHLRVLVNPANEFLQGTKCAYFPRGGPLPVGEQGMTSVWGGMEAGPNMLYLTQVIDGRVHQEGGQELKNILQAKMKDEKFIPLGTAIHTSAPGTLGKRGLGFDAIVHVAVPFVNEEGAQDLLKSAFCSGINTALELSAKTSISNLMTIDLPLLGSGARGFSIQESVEAVSTALRETKLCDRVIVRIVVLDPTYEALFKVM